MVPFSLKDPSHGLPFRGIFRRTGPLEGGQVEHPPFACEVIRSKVMLACRSVATEQVELVAPEKSHLPVF